MTLAHPILAGNVRLEEIASGGRPMRKEVPENDLEAIRKIQRALVVLTGPMPRSFPPHLGGEPDGIYGDETARHVDTFQRRVFNSDWREWDGRVGKKTLEAMDNELPKGVAPIPVPPTKPSYLIVLRQLEPVVPKIPQQSVKNTISTALEEFDVKLDFGGKEAPRDLLVTFSNENPSIPIYAMTDRAELDGTLLAGNSEIYVGAIKAMRLQTSGNACEKAFPESEEGMGSMIANTTVHEIAHALGLNVGGADGGGHTRDPDNFMFEEQGGGPSTLVSPFFEYIVRPGDVLSALVERFKRGTLDPCRFGATDLTVSGVWNFPPNKQPGFIRDPKKGKIPGRKADDPNFIYPGEKVAFQNTTLRTQAYRSFFRGHLGKKTFTSEQKKTMKDFIAQRLSAGKG